MGCLIEGPRQSCTILVAVGAPLFYARNIVSRTQILMGLRARIDFLVSAARCLYERRIMNLLKRDKQYRGGAKQESL